MTQPLCNHCRNPTPRLRREPGLRRILRAEPDDACGQPAPPRGGESSRARATYALQVDAKFGAEEEEAEEEEASTTRKRGTRGKREVGWGDGDQPRPIVPKPAAKRKATAAAKGKGKAVAVVPTPAAAEAGERERAVVPRTSGEASTSGSGKTKALTDLVASKAFVIKRLKPLEAWVSFLGDAESSLGDAKSSLGDAESSLGGAKNSLG
jgi:hypothetical protein